MTDYPQDRLFLPAEELRNFAEHTPTPFFLYDAGTIRARAEALLRAFSFCTFRPLIPVSALPNPAVLRYFREAGFGAVCLNGTEAQIAALTGFSEITRIAVRQDPVPADTADCLLDDPSQLALLPDGFRGTAGLRLNPGGTLRIGAAAISADRSRFGMTQRQLEETAARLSLRGIRVGLACQLGVSRLEPEYPGAIAALLFRLAVRLHESGLTPAYCDLGGGLGWSSRPQIPTPDPKQAAGCVEEEYRKILVPAGLGSLPIRTRYGRYLLAPAGILVSRISGVRPGERTGLRLDASSADLLRPLLCGTYYHVSVLGKSAVEGRIPCEVTGWLPENGDRLGERRLLPPAAVGDFCVFHDVGAYGQAISTDYCGNCRCAEYLYDGGFHLIRRPETTEDLLRRLIPWQAPQPSRSPDRPQR